MHESLEGHTTKAQGETGDLISPKFINYAGLIINISPEGASGPERCSGGF